nr:hypothetical protein [Candidatus Tectomicrobia bacterium]
MSQHSPYHHLTWLRLHPYRVPVEQWPSDIAEHWRAYRRSRVHNLRATSLKMQADHFSLYVSYQLLGPDARLANLPEPAFAKLHTKPFA